uniref:helix-turn-helix domain-containing protein n=1 Tax=Lentilactobacillus hilgardii TaxID=1588 RepID=UPI00403FBE75
MLYQLSYAGIIAWQRPTLAGGDPPTTLGVQKLNDCVQLWQLFGNDRFVWNQMLAMANKRYENNPKSQFVGEYDMNYLLKRFKQEYPFLKRQNHDLKHLP